MEFVWLLIGVVIGLLVAWFFLGARHRQQLAKQERELKQELARLRKAYETTKQDLSEAQGNQASAGKRVESLEADLKVRGEELKQVNARDEESRTQLSQQQSAIDDLKTQLSKAENVGAQLDQQLQDAQAKRSAADSNSRSRIADLEAQIRERNEKIAALEAELAARPAIAASPNGTPAAELRSETASLHDAATPASSQPDDLTKIKGIGPTLKDKLYGLGITSFQQIADFTPADIARVNEVLDFPGRIEREQWVEQAKAIVQR